MENGLSFDEIKIPVPWGHISGKWWGRTDKQPILAIHGWQDNAGTFDNLAPHIVRAGHSILCIDLPGHGFSSPFPPGMYYFVGWDGLQIIKRIVQYYKWTKLTLLGHSLGGVIGYVYSSAYPDEVDKYISIDIASPAIKDPLKNLDKIPELVDRFIKYDNLDPKLVPRYKYDEMVDTAFIGYNGSCTRESVEILLRRGMKPDGDDLYVFTRDPRLKAIGLALIDIHMAMEMAKNIKCKVLNIRAVPGYQWENPHYYDMILDQIEVHAECLERKIVNGQHHVHLNEPSKVAPCILEFLAN